MHRKPWSSLCQSFSRVHQKYDYLNDSCWQLLTQAAHTSMPMLQEEQDSAWLQVDALLTRCGELLTKLQASSKKSHNQLINSYLWLQVVIAIQKELSTTQSETRVLWNTYPVHCLLHEIMWYSAHSWRRLQVRQNTYFCTVDNGDCIAYNQASRIAEICWTNSAPGVSIEL